LEKSVESGMVVVVFRIKRLNGNILDPEERTGRICLTLYYSLKGIKKRQADTGRINSWKD